MPFIDPGHWQCRQIVGGEEIMPSVLADLEKRRAKIEEIDASRYRGLVRGFIALSQVLGYQRVLEKRTDARALAAPLLKVLSSGFLFT